MSITLTKGQKVTLPVVADSFGFYTVNCLGKNVKVKKFQFQRFDKTPDKLSCIVDKVDGNNIFLKQDMAPIFAARFTPGETYEFTVEADMTMTEMPHYKVTQEGLGYWIMLPTKKNLKLSHGDRVRCRVGKVQGINLNLKIVEVVDRHGEPPMELIKKKDLISHFDKQPIEELFNTLSNEPRFIEALKMLDEKNPEWILEALRAGKEHIFAAGTSPRPEDVAVLRDIAAYILEDSVLLGAFPQQRRLPLRDEMARLVSSCEDMLTALDIVANGYQSDYISDIMAKLSASGYLYRPESKLRTLMCVFALDPDSIDAKMTDFIEVIHRGQPDSWLAEPFRSAFIEQLQLYIDSCHTSLDNISAIDGDEAESRLDKMLVALAIQQILSDGRPLNASPLQEADDSMAVNRSRLYRYYTFKGNCESLNMLEKAFVVATTADIPENEFSWDDTKDLGKLVRKLLKVDALDSTTYSFSSQRATLRVSADTIDLAIPTPEAQHPVIPRRLDLWHNLQIHLGDALPIDKRNPRTILQFRDVYALVRKALDGTLPSAKELPAKTSASKAKKAKAEEKKEHIRLLPDPGDIVDIIIDPDSDTTPGAERFLCHVVSDSFRGDGYLDRQNITRGNGNLPISAFADDEGRPYRIPARVLSVSPDNTLSFSIIDELNKYILQNVEEETEVNAVVTSDPQPGSDLFSALSEYGYTMWVDGGDFAETIQPGNNIAVRIDSVKSGARPEIISTCIRSYVKDVITSESAFTALIYNYADEKIYDPDGTASQQPDDIIIPDEAEEAGQMDEPLSPQRVTELMHIIARLADIENDITRSYNYFCFARLLAIILNLSSQAEYYALRCSIIEVLDEFASNGRVDLAKVDTLSEAIINGAGSSVEAQKLRLLAALDHPERSPRVWELIQSAPTLQINRLACLILAYNSLDGFKLGRERSAIRDQIYHELHVTPDVEPEKIGSESQKVEFKTSLIYPAGNSMRRDIIRQTREILQIIAGFLNTAGGTLYIGVSDEGYVRGVAPDLEYFKSTDKMDLHLMNAIDRHFKMVDRFRFIQSSWKEYDGKQVYIINVNPTRRPIALDGEYFQRHSTSTRHVPADLEEQFLRSRSDESIPLTYVTGAPDPEPSDVDTDTPALSPARTITTITDTAETLPETPAPATPPSPAASQKRSPKIPKIATSELRDNRHYDTCDGTPFHEPLQFIYVADPDGNYRMAPDPLWLDDESALTLRLRDNEPDEDLIAIFASGHALRIEVSRLRPQGRISGGQIKYLSPARPSDSLLIYYSTDDGRNIYKRFFPAATIPAGAEHERGERLLPPDSTFLRAIIIPAENASSFSRFERNGQRLTGGLADLDNDYQKSLAYRK